MYEKKTISVAANLGAYVTVYKRDDMKEPLADLNFFDGDRSMENLMAMRIAIDEAVLVMEKMQK